MQTIFWHDYETFGADTKRDRPCQFAGVRTDLDLNIIEEPVSFYCKPSEDLLPSPDACLITGITPQIALDNGYSESEFSQKISSIFSVPQTCVAGYNSIRFDDEISRNLFYRNFYDPYEREWKNGNSRWDIIDVIRLTYALRPDGINWPSDEGVPSFRLERLSKENGIEHASAHDAMSDVYATIGLAKLIKDKQPQLYNYAFKHRSKTELSGLIDCSNHRPVFHVSSKFPASQGCCALVAPLFQDQTNKNAFIAFDLRQDPKYIMSLAPEQISTRLYTPKSQQKADAPRPAIKAIHINKCPVVAPASMLKTVSPSNLALWNLDIEKMKEHLDWIRSEPTFIQRVQEALSIASQHEEETDPELMIYSGGFFTANDKALMQKVRSANEVELAEGDFPFQDKRLPEMLFRYKARNFPSTLDEGEQARWAQHCAYNLMDTRSGYLTFNQFYERLNELSTSVQGQAQHSVLEDLKYYAESIIPYA